MSCLLAGLNRPISSLFGRCQMVVKVMQRGHMTDIRRYNIQEQKQTDETERMKSMSMKAACCQSLITETIEQYIEASKYHRKS